MVSFELTVDALTTPEAVTLTIDCRTVRIYQVNATTRLPIAENDYRVYQGQDSAGAGDYAAKVSGQTTEFVAKQYQTGFRRDSVICRLATTSGSGTFKVEQE